MEWRIETVPITQNEHILTTHIDCSDQGMYYVINGTEGYNLATYTPEEAEREYLSPKQDEARQVAFSKEMGLM